MSWWALASWGMRNYDLAIKDLKLALELISDDPVVINLVKVTEEDIDMEERMKRIVENQSSLNDKEYVDFYIKLQAGWI